MKKILLISVLSVTIWAGSSDINSSKSVFDSLIDDATYLITGKRASQPQTSNQSPQSNGTFDDVNQTREERELLKRLGIVIDGNRIEIDANKTRNFFENFTRSLEKSIDSGVKKASKEIPDDDEVGIKVEGEKVEIDLNKTKHFMERWMRAIEIFAKELNSTVKTLQ